MDASVRAGQWERANKLFADMAELGVAADQHTWNTLMRARSQLSERSVEVAVECLMESLEAGMTPNLQTWGLLIDICAKEGDAKRAAITLEQMIECGVQPTITTYTSLFRVFCAAGNMERAMQLYRQLQESDLQITGVIYGIVINAHIKERDVSKALEVYNDMRTAGLAPSNRLFRNMMDILVERGFSGDQLQASDATSLQAMVRSVTSKTSPSTRRAPTLMAGGTSVASWCVCETSKKALWWGMCDVMFTVAVWSTRLRRRRRKQLRHVHRPARAVHGGGARRRAVSVETNATAAPVRPSAEGRCGAHHGQRSAQRGWCVAPARGSA